MTRHSLAIALSCSLLISTASADIYKCVDDSGHITYTNDKPESGRNKACSLMTREQPVTTVPSASKRASNTPSPSAFPKIDPQTQQGRDNDRRKILEGELANEQKLLANARKELSEQEALRKGDEKNYQKYLDRIKSYQDSVALHERNIESLNKEISRLK